MRFVCRGRYLLEAPQSVERTLADAIERAVGTFPGFVRPLARAQLKRVVRVSQSLTFLPGADSMMIRSDEGHDWSTDLRRTKIVVRDRWGEPLTLSRWMEGPVLFNRASRPLGHSTFEFRPSEDGSTLRMAVVTSSPQLRAPIRYEVAYRRDGGR